MIPVILHSADNSDLESLALYLKGKNIDARTLETKYSCMTLEQMLNKGLENIDNLEKAVISSRKNTRVAGLFPEITAWSKYKSDERLYLYQKNNISVGKDYVSVGPDDNNTTYGDLTSFEVGGRIKWDLSKLFYNSDMIRFSDQQQKLYLFRMEIVDKLSYIYFFISMLNAAVALSVDIPEDKMLLFQLTARKYNGWFKSLAGFDLNDCGEKK
ncbi:MAG TPA: hypothetical protein ENN58_02760 [bacterium]|nr:hypothetical protein [bacterium]